MYKLFIIRVLMISVVKDDEFEYKRVYCRKYRKRKRSEEFNKKSCQSTKQLIIYEMLSI